MFLAAARSPNLESEIKRVEPYSERFNPDVADGHYVRSLLMFREDPEAMRAWLASLRHVVAIAITIVIIVAEKGSIDWSDETVTALGKWIGENYPEFLYPNSQE